MFVVYALVEGSITPTADSFQKTIKMYLTILIVIVILCKMKVNFDH